MDTVGMRHTARTLELTAKSILRDGATDTQSMIDAAAAFGSAVSYRMSIVPHEDSTRRLLLDLMRSVDDSRKAANIVDDMQRREGVYVEVNIAAMDVEGRVELDVGNRMGVSKYHLIALDACDMIVGIAKKNGLDELENKYNLMKIDLWMDRALNMPHFHSITGYLAARDIAQEMNDGAKVDSLNELVIGACGSYAELERGISPIKALVGYKLAIDHAIDAVRPDLAEPYLDKVFMLLREFSASIKPAADPDTLFASKLASGMATEFGPESAAERFMEVYLLSSKMVVDETYSGEVKDMFTKVQWVAALRGVMKHAEEEGFEEIAKEIRTEIELITGKKGKEGR